MTNEEWKEFVSIVRNNNPDGNKDLLKRLESGLLPYGIFLPMNPYKAVAVLDGLKRFMSERVLYPIGNREQIACSCGSHNGYVVEMQDEKSVYQHTVCMNCDTIQEFTQFDINNKEEDDQCFAPTSGTWLSRLAQKLLPQVV